MSFKPNTCQQISIFDSFSQLTPREQKALDNSWAGIFAKEIFPSIDESRFSVLYSENASRPNTPVNVIVGANIIKEMFDYSDDEMVENLMLDLHLQYALHTTSFEEQPLSDKTLSRFRRRCYDYEELHGVDLYRDCVKDLSEKIARMMELNGRIRRMDSMMINSNMRKLTRMELLYTCIAKLTQYIHRTDPEVLPESLMHYVQPNDFNQVVYHQRSTTVQGRIQVLLEDSDLLLGLCQNGYEGITEYELFVRCISEQTIVEDGKRRLCNKEDKQLHSRVLLNPSDPDATFRTKAGVDYEGYVANVEETVGQNGSVITDFRYEPNVHSDVSFFQERLDELPEQESRMTMVTDGGYYSKENMESAEKKNIELVTTGLTGKVPKEILKGFQLDEKGEKVSMCPAGHTPKSCCYKPSDKCYKVSFPIKFCQNCPYKEQCNPKFLNRVARLFLYRESFERLKLEERIKSEPFKIYSRLRNGIETIPSLLRRYYHLEKLPRGKQRGKFFFSFKIAAINFRKLFTYRKGVGHYAQNPLLE